MLHKKFIHQWTTWWTTRCPPGHKVEHVHRINRITNEQIPDQVSMDITYKDFCYLQDLIKNNPQAAKPIRKLICDNNKIYRANFAVYLSNVAVASYFILTNKYMNHDTTVAEMIISSTIIPITAMYTIFLPSFMYKYFLHKNIYRQIKNL